MTSESGDKAKAILRAEMTRRGVTYDDLALRLTAAGAPHTADYLRKKVHLAAFSAGFFIQCLEVMDVAEVRLD